MELNYGIIHSGYRHSKYSRCKPSMYDVKSFSRKVLKNETFAFQIILNSLNEFTCSIGEFNHISWKGLINRIRVSLDTDQDNLKNISISLVEYINDDNGNFLSDIISDKENVLVEPGVAQMLWVKGKIPTDYNEESFNFNINLHYTNEYNAEVLLGTIPCKINVINHTLVNSNESGFYLDLWQHLSSLARHYNVPFFSDDHFYIIENFIKELSTAGQKTITIVASDFPWAGQGCFDVTKNPSNLFEHNIISVKKDVSGNLILDFTALDKYIDICFKYGINKEIDIFGIIGNWNGKSFKSPLYPEYKDPFRVSYYDENDKCIKYISSKSELHSYIKLVLNHFVDKGLIERLRIFCDEPNDTNLFRECKEFINSTVPNIELKYKCAVHYAKFHLSEESKVSDTSLIIPMIGEEYNEFVKVKKDILSKGDTVTWYVCCFPDIPNQFISSPPLESRLVGPLTYMLGLSGFLRWNYCLYTEDVFKNPSYKFPIWLAGDTFFVYPGRNMKPLSSIRWENMKIGIEEYNMMKLLEAKGVSHEDICSLGLLNVTGEISDMKGNAFNFEMGYSLESNDYEVLHDNIINLIEEKI